MSAAPVLEIDRLRVHYGDKARPLRAVDGVSLTLRERSIHALVGESGCGKTTIALALLSLLPYPGRIAGGDVRFAGKSVLELPPEELRRLRGSAISMIFQDPVAGLNPGLTVGAQVEEIVRAHRGVTKKDAREIAIDALGEAGLPAPRDVAKRYPFQLSGGMCQRVIIAIATVLKPRVIIADEPTSALDVTVQAGILRELEALRDGGAAILLITHDLGIVAQVADEMAVMYAGRIVEEGAPRDILARPRHPYTWALLGTLPRIDQERRNLTAIKGAPPDLRDLPEECAFLPRCRKATNQCRTTPAPSLAEVAPGQRAACYNPVYQPL
jgi:oligopeptide/dipeptide ABC transporter ATP-binding protein